MEWGTFALLLLSGCAGGNDSSALGDEEIAQDAVFLLGRVLDPEIVPVAEAAVRLLPTEMEATTDADGKFRLGPVSPGDYVVVAEREGYRSAEQAVTILDAAPDFVTLTLDPVAANVPYHSSRIFTPYFQCVTSGRPVAFEWNTSCVGLLDFFTGMNISSDKFFFPLIIDAPGFSNLLIEMDWRIQAFGHDMGLAVWDPRTVAQTSLTTTEYFAKDSAPPLQGWLEPGKENAGARSKAIFYPTPNATVRYEIVVSSSYNNSTTVPNFALFLEHRAMLIENLFFNRPGPADFSALPDR